MAVFSAITAALTGIGTWFAGLGIVGQFLVRVGVGLALNGIASAIARKKQGEVKTPGVTFQLQQGADQPRSFIMGRGATAGSLVYHNTWGSAGNTPNAYYTRVTALSDLPVTGLHEVWVDGQRCILDTKNPDAEKGFPVVNYRTNSSGDVLDVDGDWASVSGTTDHLWVKFYDGNQTTADSFLVDTVSTDERPWSSTEVGVGVAYAIVTCRFNQELFQGGPRLMYVLDGIALSDPSTGQVGTGDNLPALQAYQLLKGLSFQGQWLYGLQGVDAARFDEADWIAQIEKCRSPVPGGDTMTDGQKEDAFGSTTVPEQYRSGGEISVDVELGNALEAILAGCNGRLVDTGWKYRLLIGPPATSAATISDGDILSTEEQTFTPFFGLADTTNGITAVYPEPDEEWQNQAAPPLYVPEYEAEDGNRRLLDQVDMPMVPYREQVQRLMSAALAEARRARRHTIALGPKYWALEPGDIINWSSDRNGYDAKLFRIDGLYDLPTADIVLDITEVDPEDYDWSAATDYTSVTTGTISPQPLPIQPFAGFQVLPHSVTDGFGINRRPAIMLRWDREVDQVSGVRYQVRVAATSKAVSDGQTAAFQAGGFILTEGLSPNVAYQVRAIYLTPNGRPVEWSNWLSVTTPDVRVRSEDLEQSITDQLTLADQTATQAAADATQALADAANVQQDHNALTAGFVGTLDAAFAASNGLIAGVRTDFDALTAGFVGTISSAFADVDSDINGLQSSIDGVSADLSTNYMTGVSVQGAISQAETSLRSDFSRQTGVLEDPFLSDAIWNGWHSQGSLSVVPNEHFSSGETWDITLAAGENRGIALNTETQGGWPGQQNAAGYVVECDFTLVSGSLQGAGLYLAWYSDVATWAPNIDMADAISGEVSLGEITTARTLFKRPAGYSGNFVKHVLHGFAGWQGFGTIDAKRIKFHAMRVRVATQEELDLGQVQDDLGATQANLSTNYYTISGADAAIASATSTLQSQMEDPGGSIGLLSADLSANYYTVTQVDAAISASELTLRSEIDGVEADILGVQSDLSQNYYTSAETDTAISAATLALQSSMEAPTGSIGSLSATLTNDYMTSAQTNAAISAAELGLEAQIGAVSADLSNNYLTQAGTESAIAASEQKMRAAVSAEFGVIDDPYLEQISSPSWARWSGQGSMTAVANEVYPIGQTLEFSMAASENDGLSHSSGRSGWIGQADADGFVLEVDWELVSGSASGAGVYIRWNHDTTSRTASQSLEGSAAGPVEIGEAVTSRVLLKKPDGTAGNFAGITLHFFANWGGLSGSPMAAKTIKLHRYRVRVATQEELDVGRIEGDLTAEIDAIKGLQVGGGTAFATLMTQLGVDAGGTSAKVTEFSSAKADLDGFSSAHAGMTVETSNGKISGFKATTFQNPDGTGAATLELLGDVMAEGSIATNRLISGLGKNLVKNSDFSQGHDRFWFGPSGPAGGVRDETTFLLRPAGTTHAGATFPTFQMNQQGASVSGYADAITYNNDKNGGTSPMAIPCNPGEWFVGSAYFAALGCTADILLVFRNSSGGFVGQSIANVAQNSASSSNPDAWPRHWVKGQAPAGAAFVQLYIRKYGTTSGSSSNLLFHKPMVELSHSAAGGPSPWSPPGTTLIDGGQMFTNSITAQDAVFATGAIQEADIGDLQVSTLKIKDQAVTIPARTNSTALITMSTEGDWVDLISLVIDREGYKTEILCGGALDGQNGPTSTGAIGVFRVLRNNTTQIGPEWHQVTGANGSRTSWVMDQIDTDLGTGLTTYKIQGKKITNSNNLRDPRVIYPFVKLHQFKK